MIGNIGTQEALLDAGDSRNSIVAGNDTPTQSPKRNYARYLSIATIVGMIGAWFLITDVPLVPLYVFPSPQAVYDSAVTNGPELGSDILATLLRIIVGLVVGISVGVGLGLAMSYSRKAFYVLNPVIESFRPMPVIALIPFFIIWFGLSEFGKVLLITLGVAMIMVVATLEAARNLPQIYRHAAATLGANEKQIFRRVVMPGIVPSLIGPLRVSTAMSISLVVAAEYMAAESGLGYLIVAAERLYDSAEIFLGVLLLGLLAMGIDFVVRRSTRYLTRWSNREVS